MPFDERDVPGRPEGGAGIRRNRAMVAAWLFAMCGMILVMIVLGGVTRLTGSGLSIMEWAPLSGTLPPMDTAEWERLFALYKQIPQYELVNTGIDLAGFKQIFWLEWTHRLWGRLIGIAFLLPLLWLWATGRIERRLRPRLLLLFVLGGLQGAVGWFMVASGFFPDATSVSPYRLVIHLVLALTLYAAILWTALGLLRPYGSATRQAAPARWLAGGTAALAALTITAGGFVAGNHAGLIYNTFPLMDGHLVPDAYAAARPVVRSFFEDPATVQFDHRVLATLTAMAALTTLGAGLLLPAPRAARLPLLALGGMVLVQYALGVATLLLVVPVGLAAAHQAGAVLVLTASLTLLHALRRPGSYAATR